MASAAKAEEAYSIAMLLLERSGGLDDHPMLQVFASELSSPALQQAREGAYPQEISASISPERLERFFMYENGRYRVRRDLRDTVTFATHDLFKDPPYSHLDLIVCRNLLSNLQPAMRSNVGVGVGLGVGLTLAKRLVELHSGSITAQSPGINQGSKFTVRLPLTHRGPVQANQTKSEAPPAGAKQRVLIVDDNEDAAETLRELIETLGVGETRTASNGPDALAAAARLHPDVVLLDLSMPGMDGYELARRMRAESWGEKARLVALTGWGQEQHRRRSKEAGFDGHLTKPADADALRAVLNGKSRASVSGQAV